METLGTIILVVYGLIGIALCCYIGFRDLKTRRESFSGILFSLASWSQWTFLLVLLLWPLVLVVYYYETLPEADLPKNEE